MRMATDAEACGSLRKQVQKTAENRAEVKNGSCGSAFRKRQKTVRKLRKRKSPPLGGGFDRRPDGGLEA